MRFEIEGSGMVRASRVVKFVTLGCVHLKGIITNTPRRNRGLEAAALAKTLVSNLQRFYRGSGFKHWGSERVLYGLL